MGFRSYIDTSLSNYIHSYFIRRWNSLKTDTAKKPRLFFGTEPILNFSYWARGMKEIGFESMSVMNTVYSINKKEDFDVLLDRDRDIILKSDCLKEMNGFIAKKVVSDFWSYLCFDYILTNFDIYHISYFGIGVLPEKLWQLEIDMIKKKGGRIIVLPYGSDWIQYSRYSNSTSFKHGLLAHYPEMISREEEQHQKIVYLNQRADVVVGGGNLVTKIWHLLSFNFITIDDKKFDKANEERVINEKETITIAHSPNHRLIKGTEFLVEAVEQLKKEGYKVELLLLEKMKNDEVIYALKNRANILVDQLLSGYALSAIEGMACGIPVIANMEDSEYDRKVYRRFSYLDECPVLTATPETIKETLLLLIKNPEFAIKLGKAGKEYVSKYHSFKAASFMFSKIYDRIWNGLDIELMSLYHPLLSNSYNNQSPKVKHPLVENKIPADLLNTLKK